MDVPKQGQDVPKQGHVSVRSKRKTVCGGRTKCVVAPADTPHEHGLAKIYRTVSNKRQSISRCQNFHERVCMEVLCSNTTRLCNEKELAKLHNRLRWSFMRHVRATKLKRHHRSPNLIVMMSQIAADIENYRLPIMNPTDALCQDLATKCAAAIFKFTLPMAQTKAALVYTMEAKPLVIGLLYLLRSGLVHKNITVLPQFRQLSFVLPPESFVSLFSCKSKIITETENIIKCYLRTLSVEDVQKIGYEAIDRVL
jgi:hypothetical protein